jgi:hypothetical protein
MTTKQVEYADSGVTVNSVRSLLRLEGLAVAAITIVLYAHSGASWWWFAALWLVPDLSLIGYLSNPCNGARIYNAVHSYVTPAALALVALLMHRATLLPFALIWINHIGLDRALGFGLKYATAFNWTHLGRGSSKQTGNAAQAG